MAKRNLLEKALDAAAQKLDGVNTNPNLCEVCKKNDWKIQSCNGDGRLHHHGAIHTKGGQLVRVCDECKLQDKIHWDTQRGKNEKELPKEIF